MKAFFRFLKNLYSGPFQATLVFSFSLVAAITIGIGTWVISVTINSYLSELMDEQIARDMHIAENLYILKLQEGGGIVNHLANSSPVVDHLGTASQGNTVSLGIIQDEIVSAIDGSTLKGGYLIIVLNGEGNIIAGQRLAANGDVQPIKTQASWSSLEFVRTAFESGQTISSTEVIPREFLQPVGLAEQAYIDLLFTPRAAPEPYDPLEGTAGLGLVSVSPIQDPAGKSLGAVVGIHLFNNDFSLVDQVKEAAQIDTATIFMGDLRVSTNVMNAEGIRAVGTRVSQEVSDTVLGDGHEFVGTAFVVDQDYITRYEPLYDHSGRVVGIYYVGVKQASFLRLLNTFNQRTAMVAMITLLMTFIFATPVSRFITRPLQELRELVKTSRRVADGDLNARAPIIARGEVGQVAESFNTMLDTLHDTQDQLVHSEKLASLGQLAAGVAHELNNPLATILLYSETLSKELPDDNPTQDDLETIVSETKRCKRIVSDLLNFARQNQVIAQPTDIHAIIQNLLDMAPRRVKTVPVEFVTDLDPNLPIIEGDPSQLRQVLLNLMTNAVESMPDGGTVTLRTRKTPPGMITIDIEDTGMGIPPENLSKLFTPFFTTKPIGKGTGLGLAIVYGIIKMHRGQIHASSKVNEGTTFTITLPIHLPSPERGLVGNPPPPPAGGEPLIG